MISLKKHLSVTSFLLIGVLVSIIAYQAGANRVAAPMQPATIAVVNLPRVMAGLEQRSSAEMQIRGMLTDINAERSKREAEVNRLQTEHEQLRRQALENPAIAAEADAVEEQWVLERLRFQAWMQFNTDHVDIEHALVLQDLYRVVKAAAADMARTEGYDLVLVDDAEGELGFNPESRVPRTAQIEQQMLSRLMLYVNPRIDITNDIIERMNNTYRAGAAAR